MASWSGAGKGALQGGAAGSVFGPWGTVIGAGVGGLWGGLTGDSGDNTFKAGEARYGGGLGPESAFAKEEAARVQQAGVQRGDIFENKGLAAAQSGKNIQQVDYDTGRAALARDQALGGQAQARGQMLGNTAQSMAFGGQQDAAYNQTRSQNLQNAGVMAANQAGVNAGQDRGSQLDALGRLRNFYEQGPGPSAAEAQMRQGADANMAQAIALAHSGRGAGANANAMRQAAFSNAAQGQQLNQQVGVLRANEAANWRGQQMNAMGLEQSAFAGLRGQDISQQGQLGSYALGAGQQGLGYGQLGAGYQDIGNKAQGTFEGQGLQGQLGFEGMGNQTNLGFSNAGNQAGLGYANVGLGYSQLGTQNTQFGETLRNKILEYQGNQQQDQQHVNAGQVANTQRQTAADQAFTGSIINTGLQAYGAYQGGRGGGTGYGPTYGDGYRT